MNLANAGAAIATNIADISAATARTKSMRLNALPATVCCCPIVFLLLVEGAGLGLFFLPPPVYWLQG